MRFLFVSNFWDSVPCGAYNGTRSHYEALNRIAHDVGRGGGEVISTISRLHTEKPEPGKLSLRGSRTVIDSIRNRLNDKVSYYSKEAEEKIVSLVKEKQHSFVWLDEFIYGSTAMKIKSECPEVPVFVFHHTVVAPFAEGIRRIPFTLKYPLRLWDYALAIKQEGLSARFADANIILNNRDENLFIERYGFGGSLLLPVCLKDTASITEVEKKTNEFNILFVGGARHTPNLEGIKWFAENVMPKLDSRAILYIVGTNMDTVGDAKEFRGNYRIKLTGQVESLDDFYNMADLAICPIFFGNGMMTKVAEALMYGKNVLATTHALNGYEGLDDCRCDTAEEFAEKINQLIASGTERYNPAMRKIYEEKYSLNAMTNMLRTFLSSRHII